MEIANQTSSFYHEIYSRGSRRRFSMSSIMKMITVMATIAAIFSLGFGFHQGIEAGLPGFIKPAHAEQRCSAHTLKGAFGVKFNGFSIKTGQAIQLDSVSLITFDGFQVFTSSETGRFNGERISRTFTGPYVVRPDCTG